jgi:predicted TIM-barrel fold metal-dependent hydrolase
MDMSGTASARAVRARLGHPVVDVDGHLIEYMPAVSDYLRDELGPRRFAAYQRASQWRSRSEPASPSTQELRDRRRPRYAWWGLPAENTLDRATAMLPALLYERMDELGLDFVVQYPTICLGSCAIDDEETRRGVCRGYNRFIAEVWAPYRDRMTPAGIVPMETPQEAIDELEHCAALGLKVTCIPHGVLRRVRQPQDRWWFYRLDSRTVWLDSYGLDSAYDYDPVWRRFVDLGFAVTSHSGLTFHSGTYTSPTNYTHNHLGAHADGMTRLCRSLFFGGVTRRVPELSVGFLECGVGWASLLLNALVEHYEKRNVGALAARDPDRVDLDLLERLFRSHGGPLLTDGATALRERLAEAARYTGDAPPPRMRDDWAALGVDSGEDVVQEFTRQFFFGCEADDRTVAYAFSPTNPFGARLKPCFSSDLGHWDVDRMDGVVAEAYELLEDGVLTAAELREFTLENPILLHLRANPAFFVGTAVEQAARDVARSRGLAAATAA